MQRRELKTGSQTQRITSLDLLRGTVMLIMALDHVRMYFALGTWYSEPTNLATTTPLLFFTRWITHFCAPVFVFLTGTSAFLYGSNKAKISQLSWYLFTRGIWILIAELTIINFAWTFDVTFSFRILQVIWAIGASLILLSVLVFLPIKMIFVVGIILVFGHNLLDPITVNGTSFRDLVWYALHQPNAFRLGDTTISLFYPILPWLGLMALGYVFGTFYTKDFDEQRRRRWLVLIGLGAVALFLALRGLNLYGEPDSWSTQDTSLFTVMAFLNTSKYPPSLHFLLMTIGPALIFLALSERMQPRTTNPIVVFGRVPFFFYILHLYFIHAFAMLALVFAGHDWMEYILTARAIASGTLSSFGLRIEAVYIVWILLIMLLYPLCIAYQRYKGNNPAKWWLSYL